MHILVVRIWTVETVNTNLIRSLKLIRGKLLENWYNSRNAKLDGKLCTFLKIKDHFGFESYLSSVNSSDKRKALCRFRISAHRLQIEVGRFSRTPRTEKTVQ